MAVGASMKALSTRTGALLKVVEKDEGQYTVTQIQNQNTLPQPVARADPDRAEIEWSYGPIHVAGYVIKTTHEIGVVLRVTGIQLGEFYGQLEDGVGVNVDLTQSKGAIKFYLKNGREVWIHTDIKIVFDGSFNKDVKLINV
ncbi:hypothetical protein ANO11243_080690 [Dothideomycetidae sp. 11243]|nr:hypothetical protein ANO11243_080690 [fungal sp. No.11243]